MVMAALAVFGSSLGCLLCTPGPENKQEDRMHSQDVADGPTAPLWDFDGMREIQAAAPRVGVAHCKQASSRDSIFGNEQTLRIRQRLAKVTADEACGNRNQY